MSPVEIYMMDLASFQEFRNMKLKKQLDGIVSQFNLALNADKNIDAHQLRENLVLSLNRSSLQLKSILYIYVYSPYDPPYTILDLPRVVSTKADILHIYAFP